MKIPLVDLKAQYQSIKEEVDQAMQNVLDSCQFIMGEDVKKLEVEVAHYCQTKFGIAVASGTDALLLSLLACDVGEDDEVLTTPFTFIATTEAISKIGSQVAFIDIDPQTFNIDPVKIKEYIEQNCTVDESTQKLINAKTRKTVKAIIPVHLYGHPVDLGPIMKLAKKYHLKVIEDCAQAIGAEYKSRKVGSFGDTGCFSFFPSKNLGCYGDGGMVVTNNKEIANKIQMLRVHGCETKYHHLVDGYNSRLDTIQAAVLRVKLKRLDQWHDLRNQKAQKYNELLEKGGLLVDQTVVLPHQADYARHVYYAYTLRVKQREELVSHLKSQDIAAMVHYPIPLYLQKVYAHLGYQKDMFPISEQFSHEVISLPIYPELTQEMQNYVANKIRKFYKGEKIVMTASKQTDTVQ